MLPQMVFKESYKCSPKQRQFYLYWTHVGAGPSILKEEKKISLKFCENGLNNCNFSAIEVG